MNAIRIRLALITLVCTGVFYISAGHIISVAMSYGNPFATAIVYPVCIDGVILISALTLTAANGVSKTAKFYAKLGRWVGFAATIYANMVHSGWASTDSVIVNAIPAVTLIITVELLIHASKRTPATRKRS